MRLPAIGGLTAEGRAAPEGETKAPTGTATATKAEFTENIAEVEITENIFLGEALMKAGGAEAVVLFALLLIA